MTLLAYHDAATDQASWRGPPAVVIYVELEAAARIWFLAERAEDERRLRLWLARESTRRHVLASLYTLLAELQRAA